MALFAIGTKVRLNHTGDEGMIIELLPDEMATVKLSDGDEIPVFLEDVVNIEDEKRSLSQKMPIKAKIVPAKKPKVIEPPEWEAPARQYTILKSKGIQLCFEPHFRKDGTPDSYTIFLVNDTQYDVLYTYRLAKRNNPGYKSHGKLDSVTAQEVDKISFDDLNEMPEVVLECWQVTTIGNGSQLNKTIKIKPKTFFKNKKTAPILNREVHWYLAFGSFDPPVKKKKEEDLKTYTQRRSEEIDWTPLRKHYKNEVTDFASFNNEIDLHIENLVSTVKGKTNQEMLYIQIEAFHKYLNRAIELGVSPVFIIHGVGKGRLKDRIANELRSHRHVKGFKNEYHHKYGWGATEVWFL